jgi:predicted dehydrogenase
MSKTIKVLCVGAGHMGSSHAKAYHAIEGFEICGIVTRSEGSRKALNADLGANYPEFGDYMEALKSTKPDAVSISTYPDTHAEFAKAAMDAGADVFIEKPLAETVAEARDGPQVGDWLHFASSSELDQIHRDFTDTW